jgi:hypothetical protein
MTRKRYSTPRIEEWTIAGLTQVGQTREGGDILPGQARGNDNGSIHPPGLNR